MDLLAERKIPLEICPASNLSTGALARQLSLEDANNRRSSAPQTPAPRHTRGFFPPMTQRCFTPRFTKSMQNAARMGLQEKELARIVEMCFRTRLPPSRRESRGMKPSAANVYTDGMKAHVLGYAKTHGARSPGTKRSSTPSQGSATRPCATSARANFFVLNLDGWSRDEAQKTTRAHFQGSAHQHGHRRIPL